MFGRVERRTVGTRGTGAGVSRADPIEPAVSTVDRIAHASTAAFTTSLVLATVLDQSRWLTAVAVVVAVAIELGVPSTGRPETEPVGAVADSVESAVPRPWFETCPEPSDRGSTSPQPSEPVDLRALVRSSSPDAPQCPRCGGFEIDPGQQFRCRSCGHGWRAADRPDLLVDPRAATAHRDQLSVVASKENRHVPASDRT